MNNQPITAKTDRQSRSNCWFISLVLLIAPFITLGAETNVIVHTLPQDVNCKVRFFAAQGGVLIDLPNPHSKLKIPKSISFNETQKWQVAGLLDDFIDLGRNLEERNMKFFTKHLGTITATDEYLKWAKSFDATIYVAEDGKALLVLTSKDQLVGMTEDNVILDPWEARNVIELIKLLPDKQEEIRSKARSK